MLAFLKGILLLPIALLVILLAVANRAPTVLSLDPFTRTGAPEIAVTAPLFALLFGALILGVLIGGAGAWLAAGSDRRARRYSAREVNRLKAEADRLRANLATGAGTALPATRPGY